jgi:hypothetical protein
VDAPLADAASAVLLAAALPDAGTGITTAAGELRNLVADDVLMLEIRGWVEDGGPDGEQLYCLADLLRTRFDADADLAAAAARLVVRDGSALAALDALARLQAASGRTGAAAWCREVAGALRSTRPVGGGRSRVLSSRLGRPRR